MKRRFHIREQISEIKADTDIKVVESPACVRKKTFL